MAKQLLGKPVNDSIMEEISRRVVALSQIPTLAMVRVGDQGGDIAYENSATKRLEGLGLKVLHRYIPAPEKEAGGKVATEKLILEELESLNKNDAVHGILLFQPLPALLDSGKIRRAIAPEKDVDCTTVENMGLLFAGEPRFVPCAAGAVIVLLRHYNISLEGKRVTLLGRSLVVGQPLATLLVFEHATLKICHTKTKQLKEEARDSDILISTVGVAGMITSEYVHENQIVIDVGTTMVDGVLCGDLSPEACEIVAQYTPTPRGVGGLTTTMLAHQLVQAVERLETSSRNKGMREIDSSPSRVSDV